MNPYDHTKYVIFDQRIFSIQEHMFDRNIWYHNWDGIREEWPPSIYVSSYVSSSSMQGWNLMRRAQQMRFQFAQKSITTSNVSIALEAAGQMQGYMDFQTTIVLKYRQERNRMQQHKMDIAKERTPPSFFF